MEENRKDEKLKRRIHALLQKGLAPGLIETRLSLKGIKVDVGLIHQMAKMEGLTEEEQVKNLIIKKSQRKDYRDIQKLKNFLLSALYSKGHRSEKAKALVEQHLDGLKSSYS